MIVGLETLRFYVPHTYLPLTTLAAYRNTDPKKFTIGLGQEHMAIIGPDEDVVSMAANAAFDAISNVDVTTIDTIIVATESGNDQSKSTAVSVHRLLGLPSNCQTYDVKQACAAGAIALRQAIAHVQLNPKKRVLVIAADIARYSIGSAAEATQGAGACAMLVSTTPRLVRVNPAWGVFAKDVMDFWRPNYRESAIVDGKFSIKMYLHALGESWRDFARISNTPLTAFEHLCTHMPFTRMADKANAHLTRLYSPNQPPPARRIQWSTAYNRVIGNTYAASIFIALAALLDTADCDLTGRHIGLYSYGSGCLGLFFSATVLDTYKHPRIRHHHQQMLAQRRALSYNEYVNIKQTSLPNDGSTVVLPRTTNGRYRLSGIANHKRRYAQYVDDTTTLKSIASQ